MLTLEAAFDDADACLASESLALADDPLGLRLPPIDGPGGWPDPATLRALAVLYLHGELEQAGLLPVAEMLAEARFQLALRGTAVAGKLEEFARRMPAAYDLASRNRIFARLFGTGRAALNGDGTPVNREFERLLAELCLSLRHAADEQRQGALSPAGEVALHQSALRLVGNLGMRPFGNAAFAASRLQVMARLALALLGDPEIGALVGGRGAWDTLAKLLEAQTPDVGRFVDRGRTGMAVLQWLTAVLAHLRAGPGGPPLAPPSSPVYDWALTWLRATGIEG